ncbi:MAG: Hsp33 family molecular chaperone HslO [Oscillospiraceae bacterium]|nr:Hsp33 family molecular chaperone HslO [Oscillospiraceae bacterium]
MDEIVRVITSDGAVMAAAISGRELVAEAQRIHGASSVATAALGRTLMATSLMGNQLKGKDNSVTVQIRGGGPIGTITCVSDAEGYVRGCVTDPKVFLPVRSVGKLDVGRAVGTDGSLTVIKDLGMKEPYIGSIPLVSGEIAEDVTSYYATSEQLPTACALGVLVDSRDQHVYAAGGFLIQLLPGADEEAISKVERGIEKIGYVTRHFQEGVTPLELVQQVLSEFDVEVLETVPVGYRCSCGKDRYVRALATLGRAELESIIQEQGGAELQCHFCNKKYQFTAQELAEIAKNCVK